MSFECELGDHPWPIKVKKIMNSTDGQGCVGLGNVLACSGAAASIPYMANLIKVTKSSLCPMQILRMDKADQCTDGQGCQGHTT